MDKCQGCGAIIQFEDKEKPGYIRKDVYEKRQDNFLCERCFRLKHYNESNNTHQDIDFDRIFSDIKDEHNLIVNIIDCFDLTGSIIPNINKIFPNSDILILANKYDIFMRSNRPTKIRDYLKKYLKNLKIKFTDLLVTTIYDDRTAEFVYEIIKKYHNDNIYFVGMTNVGKSSLINSLKAFAGDDNLLTTSSHVGTTQDITKIRIKDINIGDTPGYYNINQLTYYLERKSLNLVIPKKFIKPRVYQLYPNDSVFVKGLLSVTYNGIDKCGMSFYVANTLMLYRTKQNPDDYYNNHLNDLLDCPNLSERDKLGNMEEKVFEMKANEELCFAGIGFINFSKKAKVTIKTFKQIKIEKREAII